MYRHLFLEGPIQTGKSTLLRRLLAPYKDQIGGFASQRMLNDDGRTIGYRIGPAVNCLVYSASFMKMELPKNFPRYSIHTVSDFLMLPEKRS